MLATAFSRARQHSSQIELATGCPAAETELRSTPNWDQRIAIPSTTGNVLKFNSSVGRNHPTHFNAAQGETRRCKRLRPLQKGPHGGEGPADTQGAHLSVTALTRPTPRRDALYLNAPSTDTRFIHRRPLSKRWIYRQHRKQ